MNPRQNRHQNAGSSCDRWSSGGTLRRAAMLVVLSCVSLAGVGDGAALAARPSGVSVAGATADTQSGWRGWLRRRVASPSDDSKYGLAFDANWQQKSSQLPVVVLVHGFNSTCGRNRAVLRQVLDAGYPCAGFNYPNDDTLSQSAVLLSLELRRFATRHPERRVVVVAHSMGGLVARACIENPELDPGVVDRLIMIATPNHGTHIAKAAVATDVWEHWLSRSRGSCWARWRDSVVDGLGEAADDLAPDSDFLAELNARERNASVQYTIFLGTDAAVEEDEMNWIRGAVRKTGGRLPGVRGAASRLDDWLGGMEELVDGKGDGVVAVQRGRLAGVEDVLILPFGHLAVTADANDAPIRRVRRELLARLQ